MSGTVDATTGEATRDAEAEPSRPGRFAPRSLLTRGRGLLRAHGWTLLAILALGLLTWPFGGLRPGIGGDENWAAGVAIATEHGMTFGDEIVWTYGPLGFLSLAPQLYYGDLAALAFAWHLLVQLLLAGTIYLGLKRSFPAPVAFVLALAITPFIPSRALALAVAWSVLWLTRRDDAADQPGPSLARAFPVAIGALSAILLLGKLNHGVEAAAIAVVALAAAPRRGWRDLAEFAGALVVTGAFFWFLTGQALGDLVPFVRYSLETVSGYAAGMGAANPALHWQYWAAAVVAALVAFLVWNGTAGAPRRRRWGLLAACAIFLYLNFKSAFVKHDAGHANLFFGDALILFAVLPLVRPQRALALASMALCVLLFAAVWGTVNIGDSINPRAHARSLIDTVRTLASADRRAQIRGPFVTDLRAAMPVPQEMLDEIGDRTVASWPHGNGGLMYAHGLDWDPIVSMEPYMIYTSALDELGAEQLASDDAPERILRAAVAPIDDRFATFEAPATTVEMLCRYRELQRAEPWQLLAVGESRCGEPRELETVEARWGEEVEVPAPSDPDALVTVRIEGSEPAGMERLRELWLRPGIRRIVLDGQPFHLLSGTAADGLLLSAPAGADFRAPFTFAPDTSRVTVTRDVGNPDDTLRYVFEEIPIEPLERRARR